MDLLDLLPSFQRHLQAKGRRPRTVETYSEAVELLARFLAERDMPTDAPDIKRGHIEEFMADQLERLSSATAAGRWRYLRQFFKWAAAEDEVDVDPMIGTHQPKIADRPPPVLDIDTVAKILGACEGRGFEQRRDTAIIRLFFDTGCRLAELTGVQVCDVKLDAPAVVRVIGKGGKERELPIGAKTVEAFDRYERDRKRHPHAGLPDWWLSSKGPLSSSGVAQMLRRRCKQAGVPAIHPHQLRHTAAHDFLSAGGQESDLMRLMGWSDPAMVRVYARSAATERAHASHRRMGLGDRV